MMSRHDDNEATQDAVPSTDAILTQVDRILASADFVQSKRLGKLLLYIVEETLAGRSDRLKEYSIGVDVFERDESFDPQTSSIVRVEAGRLRNRLDKYNALEGRNQAVHISLPSGGYVPLFASNPTFNERTTPSQSIPQVYWLKSRVAFFAVLIAAIIAAMLYSYSTHVPTQETAKPVLMGEPTGLAVLPLRNLSNDIDQDYFSDGITDALITALAKRATIRVISTRSVLGYKNADKTVASIAQELDVSHVVDGAVLRIGDKVRITAQLIDAGRDHHLWAEAFEREITDAMALQNDIVQQIVTSLSLEVGVDGIRTSIVPQNLTQTAYEAQLKGRYFRNQMTEDGLRKGLRFFKEAIEEQPDYGLAYSGMAACYCLLGGHGFELIKPSEALPVAKTAALEALSLNNSLAEPHAFLGIIRLKYDWDWISAEKEFRRSIEINPSYYQARLFYSYFHETMGRKDEAISEAQEARAIDPLSLAININLGWQYLQDGQLEKARSQFEKTAELNPEFWGVHWGIGHYHGRKGEYDAAITAFQKSIDAGGGHVLPLTGLGYTYAKSGKPEKAMGIIEELNTISKKTYVSPFNTATIYAGLGDKEQSFVWLEKAFVLRSRSLVWLNVLPEFDELRSDQRFKSLIRRIGLPQ